MKKIKALFSLMVKKKIIWRQNMPYLIRYTLRFTPAWCQVKIHHIMLSDHVCLHDHPWTFISFLIKGGYVEHTPEGSKVYGRFSLLYRPAKYLHRLEVHQPVWSIVITFKKVRVWGFKTPNGWIEWFKYKPSNDCE